MNEIIKDMWIYELNNFNEEDGNDNKKKIKILELLSIQDIIDIEYVNSLFPINNMIHYDFNLKSIQKLLDKKADVNESNYEGGFPLYYAVKNVNNNQIDFLLENKADVNKQFYNNNCIKYEKNGYTPLHIATSYLNMNICKKLLDKKADPNILDINGNTPLEKVLSNGTNSKIYKEIFIKYLISRGSNIHLLNNNNTSIIDLGNIYNIDILKLDHEVKLTNAKKKLNMFKGIHYRLGENSVLKNLPFDLIDKMI